MGTLGEGDAAKMVPTKEMYIMTKSKYPVEK